MCEKAFDIKFLGTCACDFSSKLETEFKNSFDKDARRASAVLINGNYLVDAGVHIIDSLRIADINARDITDLFITHMHSDHFDIKNISIIANEKKEPLRLYIREDAMLDAIPNVTVIRMKPYQKYSAGTGLFVTSLKANHDPETAPSHFLFEKNGIKIFYGCDGAWLLNETYNYLKGAQLSLAVLDCTVGDYEGDWRMAEHNSIPMIRLMLPSLMSAKIINNETKIYLSHIAPSLHKSHKETELIAKEFGAFVSYDGLDMEV
ncbi:MAG: MBL fold metallo-hydrolase [Clostridia bacterium]|nr:MBL fold metallo-hydrolase [Clostridia bacterium]